jgi:hypothetical protein
LTRITLRTVIAMVAGWQCSGLLKISLFASLGESHPSSIAGAAHALSANWVPSSFEGTLLHAASEAIISAEAMHEYLNMAFP